MSSSDLQDHVSSRDRSPEIIHSSPEPTRPSTPVAPTATPSRSQRHPTLSNGTVVERLQLCLEYIKDNFSNGDEKEKEREALIKGINADRAEWEKSTRKTMKKREDFEEQTKPYVKCRDGEIAKMLLELGKIVKGQFDSGHSLLQNVDLKELYRCQCEYGKLKIKQDKIESMEKKEKEMEESLKERELLHEKMKSESIEIKEKYRKVRDIAASLLLKCDRLEDSPSDGSKDDEDFFAVFGNPTNAQSNNNNMGSVTSNIPNSQVDLASIPIPPSTLTQPSTSGTPPKRAHRVDVERKSQEKKRRTQADDNSIPTETTAPSSSKPTPTTAPHHDKSCTCRLVLKPRISRDASLINNVNQS